MALIHILYYKLIIGGVKLEGLCVCNIASNSLSFIDISNYNTFSCPIVLGECPSGPHEICLWKEFIVTANSYSNSISFVSIKDKKEIKNIYVGAHPSDVKVYLNKIYVLCGESNSLVIYDLIEERVVKEISLDLHPHCIDICKNGLASVANMQSNKVSIIDCNKDMKVKDILVGELPTKCRISEDEEYVTVCESNLGMGVKGKITQYNIKSGEKTFQYKVGYSPVDFLNKDEKIYVSNFEEGSISIIDLKLKKIEKISIGGMPRGIALEKGRIYVADNYKNKLIVINNNDKTLEKTITLGREPNAMVYYNLLD